MNVNHRKIASISLDLDNLWSYMKAHGDRGWEEYPSYLDMVIPRVLDILDELGLKITFFIVGKDAEQQENQSVLKSIVMRGHEVGNHSMNHEPWSRSSDPDFVREEITLAESLITKATDRKPVGFRGPGFSLSIAQLSVLEERGYLYDASTLPTYTGPFARAYFFKRSKFSNEEREKRKILYGSLGDGLKPVKPYFWNLPDGKSILEIPVTTMPVFKTPFHLTYLLYLSGFSQQLAEIYLRIALHMCKVTGTSPSFLLHSTDFIGCDELSKLSFFPGMNLSSKKKRRVFTKVMNLLSHRYDLVCMEGHARDIIAHDNVSARECR